MEVNHTMHDMPDLYAFVLRLVPEQPSRLAEIYGHQAQALFYELVRQVDPELANALHAPAQSKPFTVAILDRRHETGDTRHETGEEKGKTSTPATSHLTSRVSRLTFVDLRVTLVGADLFGPFTRALLEQTTRPAMHLGTIALTLGDVCGTPGSHVWAGYDSFAALSARAQPAQRVALRFATPTAIGQGVRDNGKPRHALLPTPDLIFGSLMRRWNDLCPEALRIDTQAAEAAWRETLVSYARIETQQFMLGKSPQKGFVGSCTYELPPDPAQARLLALLADASFFLGLGIKTARGMGVVRRLKDEGTRLKHEG